MQRDLFVKGRGLGGSSDLTLLAPVKPGFVESLESVTYKTRIKKVLDVLHAARSASHEHAAAQLLSDSVERVGAIHSVRVAVLEPEDKVLLAVTFDGPWEAYIRVLWDKVGTLLDLIFCSTVDYVTAHDSTFEEWLGWARRVQVESGFFYGPPAFTARDALYHRRIERTRMRALPPKDPQGGAPELNELRAVLPTAEEAAARLAEGNRSDDPDDVTPGVPRNRLLYERFRTGFQGMAALYRLTDLFRPGTPDGTVLRLAALSLLREFVELYESGREPEEFEGARNGENGRAPRFRREMDWLFPVDASLPGARPRPGYEDYPPASPEIAAEVQGGILTPYDGVTHGVVLLLSFDHPTAAMDFLDSVDDEVTPHGWPSNTTFFCNVAFTAAGLRACGVPEDDLELFPEEFRQGMAERAGLLGDVRNNHPRRWRLPRRLVALGKEAQTPVELPAVHAVLQLRCIDDSPQAGQAVEVGDAHHPLRKQVQAWIARGDEGIRVLAVQSLKRRMENGKAVEHFGYADGGSEPDFSANVPDRHRMQLGEVIVGHNNAADPQPGPGAGGEVQRRMEWLRNGSFLVMRKYRQYPGRLHAQVRATADRLARALQDADGNGPTAESLIEEVYAKLMGRYRDGTPLADVNTPDSQNDFDFDRDPQGRLCPLHAHIRRANPRPALDAMARPPRIVRRSMPWGRFDDARPEASPCGLLFMAYNANLSEQFEMVQRWLTGGNPTGSSSGPSCPVTGVPENGVERHFRFEYRGRVVNVPLEARTSMFDEPQVLTRLDWGMYLFTPSIPALRRLYRAAAIAALREPEAASVSWSLQQGRALLAELRAIEANRGPAAALQAWKSAIEDLDSVDRQRNAGLWAAIRADHGGLLRTPYGVLVASRDLLGPVLMDPQERYSIRGQMKRMEDSIGRIYLGMDDGEEYRRQSGEVNAALMKISAEDGFQVAFKAANDKMDAIRQEAEEKARKGLAPHYEAAFDGREIVDEVLASLCDAWFGLKGSPHFRRGSADWDWKDEDPAIYPGQFIALSRYMFQPHPGAVPEELARRYGKALARSMRDFLDDLRAERKKNPPPALAPVTQAVLESECGDDDEYASRTMAGIIMGFAPPITGALLNVLREWGREGRFWSLRARGGGAASFDEAVAWIGGALHSAYSMRPMPQIIWRTARKSHRLGTGAHAVDVAQGDVLVLGLVSGTQESLEFGGDDGRLMFGGVRSLERPHPTHACPGHAAGMGAMVGALAAMLTRPEEMKPGEGPLTFEMRGLRSDIPQVGKPLVPLVVRYNIKLTEQLLEGGIGRRPIEYSGLREFAPRAQKGLLFAWGDSWLDYSVEVWPVVLQDFDLVNALAELGYTINNGVVDRDAYCNWDKWGYITRMAAAVRADPGGSPFIKYLRENINRKPRAILLSGGGNDSVNEKLDTFLFPFRPGHEYPDNDLTDVVNVPVLEAHVAGLLQAYQEVVAAIQNVYRTAGKPVPPIIVHGYDNPIPFYKGFLLDLGNGFQENWLQKPFLRRGYRSGNPNEPVDLRIAEPAMVRIIGELNRMLRDDLAGKVAGVHYVPLQGTLPRFWKDQSKAGWFDNMHPNEKGFRAVAAKIDAAIALVAPLDAPLNA